MRAAVVEQIGEPLVVRDVPDPECASDGAIVRMGANGICRTDWHLWTGDWTWRGLAIKPPSCSVTSSAARLRKLGATSAAGARGIV
jgi:NADPH:quinone reductase-like Zn-dependent oxidoreductase